MVKRSLQASPPGIQRARKAFTRKGWTQESLASKVGLKTRQPIWRFFAGKPIERHIFVEICALLELNLPEIIDPTNATELEAPQGNDSELDALVQQVRSQHRDKIQDQCGTLQLLDIARPVSLDAVYIYVNVLEDLTSQRHLEISDLPDSNPGNFNRFGLDQRQEVVLGLEAVERYAKLMVLGKPGSGKTTLLQHIAIQCDRGGFQAERVPIYLRLKDLAEDARNEDGFNLLTYITQELYGCGLDQLTALLNRGRALILLDGLDEVPAEDNDQVLRQIRRFTEKYFRNRFVITCRIAAQKYRFEGFTEVEVADFNQAQIESFAKTWFVTVAKNPRQQGLTKATRFIEKLKLPENQQIRELVGIPLLLNLTCLVFQAKGDFPANRSELYQQGLDILLVKWDGARDIKRDSLYQDLSLPGKINLLSRIAAITFEQGNYFFKQNKVEQHIADYLRTLPGAQTDPEALQLNSEAVLKSIEAQHGLLVERARRIYSLSHLTFQEYLTARNIVTSPDPQALEKALNNLASHLTEKRWREVFLLTVGMVSDPDPLLQLMKQRIDQLMGQDHELQGFLAWVNQKSLEVSSPYKPAAVRAFYLDLARTPHHERSFALARTLAGDLLLARNLDFFLEATLALARALTRSPDRATAPNRALALARNLAIAIADAHASELRQSLQQLKNHLPEPEENSTTFRTWWHGNGQAWTEKLRAVMLDRNLGHDWQFNHQQRAALKEYYNATQLLVDCLNNARSVTPTLRQKIEQTLLVPVVPRGDRGDITKMK